MSFPAALVFMAQSLALGAAPPAEEVPRVEADDGTLIHVANEGLACSQKERLIFRPKLEAPKGAHEWLTSATFVATLELEMSPKPANGKPATLEAVRIRFFRVL